MYWIHTSFDTFSHIDLIATKLSSILDNYKDITIKDLKIIKLLFCGTPRAGKTTLRKQLLKGVEDALQESDLQPSTKIAEICDPVFIERIAMTNDSSAGNVWKWNVQKLDDIAKTLLQYLDNKQLQIKADAPVLLGQQAKDASLQECSGTPSVTADVPYSRIVQSQGVDEEMVPEQAAQNGSEKRSLIEDVDIKQLFAQAIETGQWSEVVRAIDIDKAMLTHVIDCGGQPSFQEIFPLLISGPALTLLVFKLTDDLQASHRVEYQPDGGFSHTWQDTYAVRDFIFHAISGIIDDKAFTDNKNPLDSKMLLVGTHKDKLKGSEENKKGEIKRIAVALHGWLRELKVFKSIDVRNVEDLIIAINNFEQQDFPKVRKRIEELVYQAASRDIPAPWLVFDFVLHSYARSKKLHRVEKVICSEIARECGVKDDEFDVVLHYLHSTAGTLLYYSDIPELNNCVITDFQLIFDSISKIVIQHFEDNSESGLHLKDKDLFHETRQFEYSVLRDVDGCLRKDELLSLMQYRHVVSKMDENRFFMPSVLPKADFSPSRKPVLPKADFSTTRKPSKIPKAISPSRNPSVLPTADFSSSGKPSLLLPKAVSTSRKPSMIPKAISPSRKLSVLPMADFSSSGKPSLLLPKAVSTSRKPYMLPKNDVSPSNSCSFLVMFECGYCPIGLFCAVTTAFIVTQKWRLKKDDHQFRNKISFYCSCSGRSYHIIFSAFFPHYEVCLICDKENDAKQDVNYIKVNIYKTIDEVLKKVCKDMHYKIPPSYGFYCPNECTYRGVTYEPYKHPAKCTFDSEAKEMVCYYSDKPTQLKTEHTSWFHEVIV